MKDSGDKADSRHCDAMSKFNKYIFFWRVRTTICCDKTKIGEYIYPPENQTRPRLENWFYCSAHQTYENVLNMRATAACCWHGWEREMLIYFRLDFAPILPNRHRPPPSGYQMELHSMAYRFSDVSVVIFVFRFVSLVLDCAELSFRLNNTIERVLFFICVRVFNGTYNQIRTSNVDFAGANKLS